MAKKVLPPPQGKLLRAALWRTLLLPVLLLIFFIAAPTWYSYQVHNSLRDGVISSRRIPESEKAQRIAYFDNLDLEAVCFHHGPRIQRLYDAFEKDGICGTFERLWWGLIGSGILVGLLVITMLSIMSLNLDARKSLNDLIRNYRLSWKLAMTMAVIKLVLLIPLLAYGSFEFTVLLTNHFLPKLLILIIFGGLFALWASFKVLLKRVPLEFAEPMSREITPEEAPELWETIRQAAAAVQATPPDRVIVGLKISFYVTELAVKTDTGSTKGRTLYLSYLFLKQLSREEVLAIIGHELGHFKRNDTRMTREFYPLRLKVNETIMALARSGWVGWPSWGLLAFFNLTFEKTIQGLSRKRELLADQVGAALTSPDIAARALVKFSVLNETFQRMLKEPVSNQMENPMEIRWHAFIDEKILPDDPFWSDLAEKKLPHPLDSHPPLQDRLQALGDMVRVADARAISLQAAESAYDSWFAGKEELFSDLNQKVEKAVGESRSRARLVQTDYHTAEGKELLERHFPEIHWRKKGSGHTVGLILFGVVALFCLVIMFVVPGILPKVMLGALVALFVWIASLAWKSSKDEIVLTADGILAPHWKRPLRFAEVETVQLMRINYALQIRFNLKTTQPTIAKWSLRSTMKAVLLPISTNYNQKPTVMTQTIYRYFIRQPEALPDGLAGPEVT